MRWGRLSAEDHRGARIPVALGLLVAAAAGAGLPLVSATTPIAAAGWLAAGGSLLVFAAGVVDDLNPGGPRGLRAHLRALASFEVTTGILKLFVVASASLVVVVAQPERSFIVRVAGVATIAASANLWNGLDVAPGRALKAFLPTGLALVAAGVPLGLLPTAPGVLAGAVFAFPLDLRERAMLGDGGANLVGFTAGLGLYVVLPDWGVLLAAVITVALNVVADTVTLSRLIEGTPPLAWLDRLGRLRAS